MKKMSEVEDATTEHGSETIRDSKLMKKFLKVVPGQYIQLVESLEQEKDTGDQRMLLTQSKGCGIRSTRGSTGDCGPTGAGSINGGRSNAGGGGSGWNSSGGDGRLRGGDGSNGCYDNWNGGRFSGGRNPFSVGGASLRSGGVSRSSGSGRLNDGDGWRDDDDGSCWNGGGGAGSSAFRGGDDRYGSSEHGGRDGSSTSGSGSLNWGRNEEEQGFKRNGSRGGGSGSKKQAQNNYKPNSLKINQISPSSILILTPTETRKKICQKLFVTDAINRAITRQNVRTESKNSKRVIFSNMMILMRQYFYTRLCFD